MIYSSLWLYPAKFRSKILKMLYLLLMGTDVPVAEKLEEIFWTFDGATILACQRLSKIGKIRSRKMCERIYRCLYEKRFPFGYHILCANCYWGSRQNGGVCPHKRGSKNV